MVRINIPLPPSNGQCALIIAILSAVKALSILMRQTLLFRSQINPVDAQLVYSVQRPMPEQT